MKININLKKIIVTMIIMCTCYLGFSAMVPIVVWPGVTVGWIEAPVVEKTIEAVESYVDEQKVSIQSKQEAFDELNTVMGDLIEIFKTPPTSPEDVNEQMINFAEWYNKNIDIIDKLSDMNPLIEPLELIKTALELIKMPLDDLEVKCDSLNLDFAGPPATLQSHLASQIKACNQTIKLMEELCSPLVHYQLFKQSLNFSNNNLGMGNISIEGNAYAAFGMNGIDLRGSIVYIAEYPQYSCETDKKGRFSFTGLAPGMDITLEIVPLPNLNNIENEQDVLEFIFGDLTGYFRTRTETFTIGDRDLKDIEVQVPSNLVFDIMCIVADERTPDLHHKGLVMTTVTKLDHNKEGAGDCTVVLEKIGDPSYHHPAADGPIYFGSAAAIEKNLAAELIKLIMNIMGVSEKDAGLFPLPSYQFTSTTYDGGAVFINVPPGEYWLKTYSNEGNRLFRKVKVKVESGKLTNTTHPYGPHCISEISNKERNVFLNPHINDLIGYWGFQDRRSPYDPDEKSADGDMAHDFTQNKHHGFISGGTWVINDGVSGSSLKFDGNTMVTTDLTIDQSTTTAGVTFEAWACPDALAADDTGIKQVISTDEGWYDWSLYHQNGTWHVFTGKGPWDTGVTVSENMWQQVAVTFDQNTIIFYKNGIECARYDNPGFDDPEYTKPLMIGGNPGYANENFCGKIDSVAVYNRVLTPGEILKHCQQFNSLYIVNETIDNQRIEQVTGSIYVGPGVTITNTANVKLNAGVRVLLRDGTTIEEGADFEAYCVE